MPTRNLSSTFTWPVQNGTGYQVRVEYREEDFVDMHNLDVTVTTSDNQTQVARCKGAILKRPSNSFFEQADAVSQELQELSVIFCESNGHATRVKHPTLVADDTAVHGGGFLNVESIEVKPSHAGKDLGLRILHELFTLLKQDWTLCVIVPVSLSARWCKWPENSRLQRETGRGPYEKLTPQEVAIVNRNDQKVQRHLARIGFVQAGWSRGQEKAWFLTRAAYFGDDESNESAISRWLTKEQSNNIEIHQEPEKHVPTGLDAELKQLIEVVSAPQRVPTSMLMIGVAPAVSAQDRLQTIRSIESLIQRGASIHGARAMHRAAAGTDPYLLQTLVRLGGNINDQDENGNTPLHVAAAAASTRIVDYLVGSGGADSSITNRDGHTPLQTLVNARQNTDDFHAAFGMTGMPPREIDVIPKFECIKALMPHSERSRLIEGWMSPRMHELLKTTAAIDSDFCIDQAADSITNRADYIPLNVMQHRTDKAKFRDGWGYVWRAIYEIMENESACVPTVQRVNDRLRTGQVRDFEREKYQSFLQQGGRAEYAVDALVKISENVVKDGDDGYEYETFRDDIEALPPTAFDKDFDLAWIMCITRGGGNLDRRGPLHYSYFIDDEE